MILLMCVVCLCFANSIKSNIMDLNKYILFIGLLIGLVACQQKEHKVTYQEGSNILIDATTATDSGMMEKVAPYKADIDAKMNTIIGRSKKELLADKPESPLSNFVSDVIQHQAQAYLIQHKMDSIPVVSLMNIKGLRAPIPLGDITIRNIFEVMPFENEIVLLALPGDSILSLFKYLGTSEGDGIAGASVVYDGTKLREVLLDNKAIDPKKNYFLATSDYLANGGDHYHMIMNASFKRKINMKLREAIIEEIQDLSDKDLDVDANVEGRIIFN